MITMKELIKSARETGFKSKAMMLIWRRNCDDIDGYDPLSSYLYLCELQKHLEDNYKLYLDSFTDYENGVLKRAFCIIDLSDKTIYESDWHSNTIGALKQTLFEALKLIK